MAPHGGVGRVASCLGRRWLIANPWDLKAGFSSAMAWMGFWLGSIKKPLN